MVEETDTEGLVHSSVSRYLFDLRALSVVSDPWTLVHGLSGLVLYQSSAMRWCVLQSSSKEPLLPWVLTWRFE